MTYIFTDPVSVHEIVVSAFIFPHSIQETLNTLCEASRSVSDPKKDMKVCQFLERLFSEIFPGCKALPFGSRVSGLAFSDSDLDIFLDTGTNNRFSRFEALTAALLKIKIL
jgi:DNA polymerase sigma